MSTYGLSVYGTTTYGLSRPVSVVPGSTTPLPAISSAYLIDPFTAMPVDYESIRLTWAAPDTSTSTVMSRFRILSSRYGFPVDETDGNILLDTTSPPGTQLIDQNVVPGQVMYYGFYILGADNLWVRAGFTACLMPVNHSYANMLWNYLPEYMRDVTRNELTANAAGDTYLSQFLAVAGWSLDYLKTQYDFLFNYQNRPMRMAVADLAALTAQLGMPFSNEIPAYYQRKGAANWATVMLQRGSLTGISEHIDLLSGYGTDIQLSRNIMLETDQSQPQNPVYSPWSSGKPYNIGDIVSWPVYSAWVPGQPYVVNNYVAYNGTNYSCLQDVTGIPPAGANTSSTYWAVAAGPYRYMCISPVASLPGTVTPPAPPVAGTAPTGSNAVWVLVYDADSKSSYSPAQTYTLGQWVTDNSYLYTCIVASSTGTAPTGTATSNATWAYVGSALTDYLTITGLVGNVSTWEVLGAASGASSPNTEAVPVGSLIEGIGVKNPSNAANDYSLNSLRVYNRSVATQDTWLRSVSRSSEDVTAGYAVPDQQVVIEHAVPVPQAAVAWDSSVRYVPGNVVTYNRVNYLALRASTGALPPALGHPLNANYDFESGISPWASNNYATPSQSNLYAYHGSYSLLLTPSGSGSYPSVKSETVSIIPLAYYESSVYVYMPVAWASGVVVSLTWINPFGSIVSHSQSSVVYPQAGVHTLVSVSGQAPTGAVSASIHLQVQGTPASTVLSYWDMAKLKCVSTPEWLPLGTSNQIPLMISAQTSQNLSESTPEQFEIYPFAEWYDNWGNLISRVFSRTLPANTYTYDSFTSDSGLPLTGRFSDTSDQAWLTPSGDWKIDGNGNVYAVSGNSMGLMQAAVSCTQAVTFTESPQAGEDTGLIFWYQSASAYWHAGTQALWYYDGTWTNAVGYTANISPGDRIYVVTNQSTPSVTVYRNAVQAYNATTKWGQIAQLTGASIPGAMLPASNATVYSGIASEAV